MAIDSNRRRLPPPYQPAANCQPLEQNAMHQQWRVVRPLSDVEDERHEREPRPDPGGERGEEEEPEPRGGAKQPQPCVPTHAAHRSGAAARQRESAAPKRSFSSGAPTVTRIASGAPKGPSGRTITPSRSSASNSGPISRPQST